MAEIRGYKLNNGETHTRADGTVLTEAYIMPISVFAERLKKHAVIQMGLWKDRATFISVLQGSTTNPVYTFPIEINGDDFDVFSSDTALFADHLGEYLTTHNPSNLENIDFTKFTREAEGQGIILPLVITGLVFLTGLSYFMANNFPDLLAFLP